MNVLQLCDSHITESEFPQWKGLGNCLQPPLQDYQKAELQQSYHGALWVTERVCGKGWFFALRHPPNASVMEGVPLLSSSTLLFR